MNTTLDERTVSLAYQLLLGRMPENAEAVHAHLALGSLDKVRSVMMESQEFRSKTLQSTFSCSKWVSTEVLGRFVIWIDLHDRYVSHGCLHDNWEPEETSFFASRLRAADVVLDIGANIGWFSLLSAKHIGGNGRIHSFEPRPETARMLKRTISDNRLMDVVKVWEYALSDHPAVLPLTWGRNTDNPGSSYLLKHSQDASRAEDTSGEWEHATVRAVPLDQLLPDISPDIVKIDVEGAEVLALRGARDALKRGRPVILSEMYPAQLKAVSGVSPQQFIGEMKDIGYECYLLEKGVPTRRLGDFPAINVDLVSVVFEWAGAH